MECIITIFEVGGSSFAIEYLVCSLSTITFRERSDMPGQKGTSTPPNALFLSPLTANLQRFARLLHSLRTTHARLARRTNRSQAGHRLLDDLVLFARQVVNANTPHRSHRGIERRDN